MAVMVSLRSGSQAERRYLRPPSPLHFPVQDIVPETSLHLRLRTALFLVIERELRGRAFVGSDQFLYWAPTDPKACLSPDVVVRLGGPLELLPSYKIWLHGAPHLAVEIVSKGDARDHNWKEKLERYRQTGIGEVVRFDPSKRENPLRLWDFIEGDLVERDLADPEGRRCDTLGAYWVLVKDETLGTMLRIASDPAGRELWLTPEEIAEAAYAEKQAALARVAELERLLREKG
jgi:Uma2 family endonuclease